VGSSPCFPRVCVRDDGNGLAKRCWRETAAALVPEAPSPGNSAVDSAYPVDLGNPGVPNPPDKPYPPGYPDAPPAAGTAGSAGTGVTRPGGIRVGLAPRWPCGEAGSWIAFSMVRRRDRLTFCNSEPLPFPRICVHDDGFRPADRTSNHRSPTTGDCGSSWTKAPLYQGKFGPR